MSLVKLSSVRVGDRIFSQFFSFLQPCYLTSYCCILLTLIKIYENSAFLDAESPVCAEPVAGSVPPLRLAAESEHSPAESSDSNVMDGGYTIQAEAEKKQHSVNLSDMCYV